ncbi:MAG: GxxExxY protein [Planctomycetota bacterium]|nr:MAG: GxxExxY protein [Planctomycetota bacterium]
MFENEGYALMGAAFEVYNVLGYGLAEEVYQESLEIELILRGIPFVPKQELRLAYKGKFLQKRYVPDLFVANALVVELKAMKELHPDHEAQLFNYMRIARLPVGYLINFGAKDKVEWKRFILSDLHTPAAIRPTPGSTHDVGN